MRLHPSILSACVVLAAAAPACAGDVTLFDSLVLERFVTASYATSAASFSTGSEPIELTNVTLSLLSGGPGYQDGTFTVYLLADSSTSPGATIATLAASVPDADLSLVPTDFSIDVAPGIELAANTRYWIEVEKTPLALNGMGMDL